MSRPGRITVVLLAAFLLVVAQASAGEASAAQPVPTAGFEPGRLFPGATFDPAIPTQRQLIGVEHGQRPLRHDELLRYLEVLDEASPRATLLTYARTWEGRPMVVLAVSDEATIAGLEAFREEHGRRVDPRGRAAGDDEEALAGARAVAWMAYGIHGDELSSVDAAAALAYRLVAGEDETARRMRAGLVVLIDPCENPDGRERYLAQIASFAHRTPTPDPEDLAHTAVWPWGRGNHYLFDLNRDWFTLVQPESARSGLIASWNPQLMVDSHEMGDDSSYLFSPPRHPFNPHRPASQLAWGDRFAADQAHALDTRGYPYFTREWNEEFFPGYGSSWASYLGAVGILYEMSGTAGTLVRKHEGAMRTYPEAVEHQVLSSVANLTTLLDDRAAILADFLADRRSAIEDATAGRAVGAWLLPEGRHPERTRELVRVLERQGIDVLRSAPGATPRLEGLRDIRTGEPVDVAGRSGTLWLVPLDQPAEPLIRAVLDPHVPMEAPFLREEREYQELGKGTRLYEVTAWSMPLAYGVEAMWMPRLPAMQGWSRETPHEAEGRLVDADSPFGWLIDGVDDRAQALLADLLQQDVAVLLGEKPFRIEGRDWPAGSLLVRHEGNASDVADRLRAAAKRRGIEVRAVSTALSESGPDLGGSLFHPLLAPRVAVLTGWPVSPSDYGAMWHLFDEVLGLRFTARDVGRFGGTDLTRYNVIIFPPAFGGSRAYRTALGEGGLKALRTWVEGGGTAIGIGSGASFLADESTGLTSVRLRSQALDRFPPAVLGPDAATAQAAGPPLALGLRAPAPPDDEKKADAGGTSSKRRAASTTPGITPSSPYDVAPILGPGARPFAEGHDQGTPVTAPPVDLAKWLEPVLPPGQTKPTDEDIERADKRLRRFAPEGAFLRVELDRQSWMSWGLGGELDALIEADDALVSDGEATVVASFPDVPRMQLGGLLWPEAAGRLARTAYATRESKGRGQVVLFLDDPEFRSWTLGTRRLLTHAVLYGPGLGTRWSTPW